MSGKTVEMDIKERICNLTLNQPNTLNAMSEEMAKDFSDAIEKLKKDPEPKVVIVTGSGRAFSAGADLGLLASKIISTPSQNKENVFDFYRSFLRIMDLKIPTIAAINGHAIGAGACLPLACDMRLATNNCKIGFTFTGIGLHPGIGAEYFLPRIIGRARTFELLMTGDIITSEEAYRIGLINHLTPPEELMNRTMKLAKKIAAMPVLPIRLLKQSIDAAINSNLTDTLHREATYQSLCFLSGDLQEGIDAVREKRTPQFRDE